MATGAGGVSARSGQGGYVIIGDGDQLLRVKQWSLNVVTSESAWGDSDSGWFTNRKAARMDATGSITAVEDDNSPGHADIAGGTATNLVAGQIVRLQLFEKTGKVWNFPCALLQSYNVVYDMDTKEVVEYSIDFGSDGAFTKPV